MASVKNISLKSIVKFKGHEGESLLQGNICINGKTVGTYSDDSWGGPTRIDVESTYIPEFKTIAAEYRAQVVDDCPSMSDGEFLMCALTNLIWLEKDYVRYAKKGLPIMVCADDHPEPGEKPRPVLRSMVAYCPDESEANISEKEFKEKGYHHIKRYSSAADFIIN